MKNEIYDNMLSAYGATTEQERRNANALCIWCDNGTRKA